MREGRRETTAAPTRHSEEGRRVVCYLHGCLQCGCLQGAGVRHPVGSQDAVDAEVFGVGHVAEIAPVAVAACQGMRWVARERREGERRVRERREGERRVRGVGERREGGRERREGGQGAGEGAVWGEEGRAVPSGSSKPWSTMSQMNPPCMRGSLSERKWRQ